ncbi:SDR family NAD(P)-dependent oxidoreductase [Nocardioides zeae]|uniref:SDR family NAD(P)-dependent oxidoreductase n=1 Tax=Nocardioides imazamoxiresistens TaxID=3231893 RepID=A0ABU3PR62_9ACTN|nr:SDR family NAD(P)-dependent oxidoreductase [Nocardioides zeae]MDT9591671.1 SDR family NAD(P)-dependent oxidoreductase [Nocardioides zeae]
MGAVEGRVVVVTGAGRGLGRAHALLLAAEGARVVVNDLGASLDGSGAASSPAADVVEEIRSAGGEAVVDTSDVATTRGAADLVARAVDTWGRLDVVVNNAGILRDAPLSRLDADDFDAVLGVHLRGHYAVTRAAVDHWRPRAKAGEAVRGSVVNTVSASGTTHVLPGQAAYAAAKAGIAAFTLVSAAELGRIGVRVNAISPGARTRMTSSTPGSVGELMAQPVAAGELDVYDPAQASPLVVHLAAAGTDVTGRVFAVRGGLVEEVVGWAVRPDWDLTSEDDWTVAAVAAGFRREDTRDQQVS